MAYIVLVALFLFGLSMWGLSNLTAFVATLFGGALVGALVFGSMWFWLLIVAASCWVLWSIDDAVGDGERYDGGIAAPFVLLLTLLVLQVFGDVQVFSYITQHPVYSFYWLAGYLAAGVGYSVGRWFLFVRKRKRKFFEKKNEFFVSHQDKIVNNIIPEGLRDQWINTVANLSKKQMARAHKGRIIHWVAYWPWSAVWFVVSDLVKDFFRELFETLHYWYQKISDVVWADVERETQGITVRPSVQNKDQDDQFPDLRRGR